ncbi:GNAT family N-acetyltransferase [Alteromonas sp. 5E99-2]|uniref:GNAT family N-acetyltransferase n=1 Tax=Alteromonas sp. 5E99-2 TaxID=2817683 RepID=UPI001A97EA65|nr:GNAT family N-acetyltransferase [Alteromonas sp. 5E99-2]MBO1255385.1 GNAT family N-acetyltransferase [Alteromonas sp. 5E99-2]
MVIFETNRLIIREWIESDRPNFYEMSADEDVMKFFPKTLTKEECDRVVQRLKDLNAKNGCCFWSCELKETNTFIGLVGLNKIEDGLPFAPCVEIGWRFSKNYWGKGYATEAAKGCLEYGFETLNLNEIVSFAVKDNKNSIKVMESIGMVNNMSNFIHPKVDVPNLKEHVLFKAHV